MSSRQPTHHGYAVNVKDRELYSTDREPLPDDEAQALYYAYAGDFWALAQEIGAEHGFEHVYSEGREGGWAVPDPQPDGELPEDELARWELERFRPFERDILALMADVREAFGAALADAVERAKREPVERAYWAARDVATID